MAFKKYSLIFISIFLLFFFITNVRAENPNPYSSSFAGTLVKPTNTLTNHSKTDDAKNIQATISEKLSNDIQDFENKLDDKRKVASDSYQLLLRTFKTKLDIIKDQKKKDLTDKINTKLSDLNKKFTDKFTEALNRLNEILTRLINITNEAKAAGKDTTLVLNAITVAQNKIASAKAAVLDQAGTNYIAQVNNETTLFTTVGQSVKVFESDINAVWKLVVDAKQAVMNIVTQLAKLGVGDLSVGKPELTPTKSASASPTVMVTGEATSGAVTK